MPSLRPTRPLVACAALGLTLLALSACRTSPGVAAYVGSETITADQLDAAVQAGLADEGVAASYDGRLGDYRQLVLQSLIDAEVYDVAADRYGVEVTDADVDERLQEILDAQDRTAEDFFAEQSAQGRGETEVREQIREFIISEEIADEAELDGPTSDSALREQYDAVRDQYAQFSVGLITVADQATADTVLADLTADPSRYAELATANPNQNTLPEPQTVTAEQLAGLVPDVSTLVAGEGLTGDFAGTGEITVLFFLSIDYPSFDDLRPTLEQQAGEQVQAAVAEELAGVRADLDITVNPRYGSYDPEGGALGPADSDVVTVLTDPGADAATDPDPLN